MVPEISERASRPLIYEKSPEGKKTIKQKAKYKIKKIRQLVEYELEKKVHGGDRKWSLQPLGHPPHMVMCEKRLY